MNCKDKRERRKVYHCSLIKSTILVFVADIDECLNSTCGNNATCINTMGSYACNCTAGWMGSNCTEGILELSSVHNINLLIGFTSIKVFSLKIKLLFQCT